MHRRLPGGEERPILQTEMIRADGDEDAARQRRSAGGDGRWWLVMTIIAVLFSMTVVATDASITLVKVRTTNGAFHYKDLGQMYPGSGTGTIRIVLGGGEMLDALRKFNELATKAGGPARWIAAATEHDIVELERAMTFFSVTEEEEEEHVRVAKSLGALGTIYNWFHGLFNTAKISDIEFRLDKQQDANKLEVQEISGLRNVISKMLKATNVSEEIIAHEIASMSERQIKEHIQRTLLEEYTMVNSNATSLTRILRSATSHRTDPAIADLVNMTHAWEDMEQQLKEKDMLLPGKDWQHIFAMPLDVYVHKQKITLAIHFPTRTKTTRKMNLHSWIPTPLFTNNQLLQVDGELRVFGSDDTGEVTIISEVADCMSYGPVQYCRGPIIHERKGFFTSCVSAVWRMNIPEIRRLCEMTITPLRDSITPVGSRKYQLTVEKEMLLLVECKDGRSESKVISSGMYQVEVVPSCFIQNDLFKSEEGAGVQVQTTMIKALKGELSLLTPEGADNETISRVTERLRKVKQPTQAADLSRRIMDDLEARGSAVTKFYVIIGVLAGVLLLVAAGGIYILWRGRGLQTLVQANQLECRRHQPEAQEDAPAPAPAPAQGPNPTLRDSTESLAERVRQRDLILQQLEQTLSLAEQRMSRMQPEERDEMLEKLDKTRHLIEVRVRDKFPELPMKELVIPESEKAFIAPDTEEGVVQEAVYVQ